MLLHHATVECTWIINQIHKRGQLSKTKKWSVTVCLPLYRQPKSSNRKHEVRACCEYGKSRIRLAPTTGISKMLV